MLLMIRAIIILAALVASSVAFGDEQRCIQLGADCTSDEPLNTNTHNGGNTNWSSGTFDPDDSTDAKECPNFDLNNGGGSMVPAGSLSFLPPGNALSYVFRRNNAGLASSVGEIDCKAISEATPDVTVCSRVYRRWPPGNRPPSGSSQNQMKILTFGGRYGSNSYNPWQISWGGSLSGENEFNGTQNLRFDGSVLNGDQSPLSGNLSGFRPDLNCVNNFCRFEICLDWNASRVGNLRLRATPVAPGSGISYTAFRGPGLNTPPDLLFANDQQWHVDFWSSGFAADTYNSHLMGARHRPMDTNFWIGPACEVEGGCGATPPPTSPPATAPPPAPVLLP